MRPASAARAGYWRPSGPLGDDGGLPPSSFLLPFLPAPVHRLIPLRSFSRPVGHFRTIASPSVLISTLSRFDSTRLDSIRLDSTRLYSTQIRLALHPSRSPSYLLSNQRDRIVTQKIDERIATRPSPSVIVTESIPIVRTRDALSKWSRA